MLRILAMTQWFLLLPYFSLVEYFNRVIASDQCIKMGKKLTFEKNFLQNGKIIFKFNGYAVESDI